MKISLHDNENGRVIVATVPQFLIKTNAGEHRIAEAIITALGLSEGNTEYMIGDFTLNLDHDARNDNGAMHKLEELTQDFEIDALEALRESELD